MSWRRLRLYLLTPSRQLFTLSVFRSDITLLIIDECHHTHKEHVYNKIMRCYVEKKLQGEKRLPQILGLTASPGTGNAKILEKAVEHVLQVRHLSLMAFSLRHNLASCRQAPLFSGHQVCANMDSVIVQAESNVAELKERVRRPTKTFDIVDQRPQVCCFVIIRLLKLDDLVGYNSAFLLREHKSSKEL